MADKIITFVARVLEVMFFTGLVGCALMIIVSWIEIFSDGFSDDDK
jgi:hypothetical protein